MPHDHIGVTRFVANGFSKKGQVYCYNLMINKAYFISVKKLGTKSNYYDVKVEQDVLANGIENEFALLYNDFCKTDNPNIMMEITNNNIDLIEKYLTTMYMRSKKVLNDINENSISSLLLGELSHSKLLMLNEKMRTNFASIVGENRIIYPLLNKTKISLINNSIGFGYFLNKDKKISIFIPFNTTKGIVISNIDAIDEVSTHFIDEKDESIVNAINKSILKVEKQLGNGFIFGANKEDIEKFIGKI